MRETWYVLEDGSVADPDDVAFDAGGRLVHRSGVVVAMRGDVPHSRGVDPDVERAKAVHDGKMSANEARSDKGYPTLDSTADRPKRAYHRRDLKAD